MRRVSDALETYGLVEGEKWRPYTGPFHHFFFFTVNFSLNNQHPVSVMCECVLTGDRLRPCCIAKTKTKILYPLRVQ